MGLAYFAASRLWGSAFLLDLPIPAWHEAYILPVYLAPTARVPPSAAGLQGPAQPQGTERLAMRW
ncbi:MAG TPA: hypothetical protein VMV57_12015 [Terracidiphilus sp.]|nr:hypothetical protein [Terracidiphilus sp.]